MGASAVKAGSLSRREFLTMSGQAGLGALALTAGGGALLAGQAGAAQREAVGGVREIHLEAREMTWEIAPGKRIKAMAYNGQIPGPEIRLKEGKRVRIFLKNSLPRGAYGLDGDRVHRV